MARLLIWLTTLITFVGLDAIWLTTMGPRLYHEVLSDHMKPGLDLPPVVAFYLIFTTALVVLVVLPAVEGGTFFKALAMGALFGFAAYATYDLSNQATLSFWQWRLTLIDMAWGTIASAIAALAGYEVGLFARQS